MRRLLLRFPYVGVMISALIIVGGCTEASVEIDRTPSEVGTALAPIDKEGMWFPVPYAGAITVDPQWVTEVQWAGEIFIGAKQTPEALQFIAVDVDGNELWKVERPLTCSGFAISEDETGNAIVVLLDTEFSEQNMMQSTASAFDLATGELKWGPVEVPGPHQGPGLIFAAPPEVYMGDLGPKVALNPANGEVYMGEGNDEKPTIIGEYNGILLTMLAGQMTAQEIASNRELWQTDISRFAPSSDGFIPAAGMDPVAGFAFIQTSPDSSLIIDLQTGTVVAEKMKDVALDPHSETLVYLDDQGLHARSTHDLSAAPLWSVSVAPGVSISGAGGVFVYLIDGDSVRVHNVLTGDVVMAYQPQDGGRILVPRYVTPTGAAILLDGSKELLATIRPVSE